MASPTRYDVAIYDDPNSIYEQAWVVYTSDDDVLDCFAFISKMGDVEYNEDDDILSSNSNLFIFGSTIYNEDNDSLTSNSKLYIVGVSSYIEDSDSSDSTAILPILSVLVYTSDDDSVRSYIVKSPWGSTSSNATSPFESSTGINPNPPYQITFGYYGNRRPYEEN